MSPCASRREYTHPRASVKSLSPHFAVLARRSCPARGRAPTRRRSPGDGLRARAARPPDAPQCCGNRCTLANTRCPCAQNRAVPRLGFAAALSGRAIARSLRVSPSTVGDCVHRAEVSSTCFRWCGVAGSRTPLSSRAAWGSPSGPGSGRSRCRWRPGPEPTGPGVHRRTRGWSDGCVRRPRRAAPRARWRSGATSIGAAARGRDALAAEAGERGDPPGRAVVAAASANKYRTWAGKLDVVMRREHRAGERMFVAQARQAVPVIDPETGELRQSQIFAAVLGTSSCTSAEATWTQTLPDLDVDADGLPFGEDDGSIGQGPQRGPVEAGALGLLAVVRGTARAARRP